MADFSNIENQIDNAITTNGVGAITGAILNAILKGMLSAVDAAKEDTLTFDTEPTEDSTKPVTSGGVYDALEAAAQGVATALADYYTKTEADTLLAAKADDADVVHKTGNETIAGTKTFSERTFFLGNVYLNGTDNIAEDLHTKRLRIVSNGNGSINASGRPVEGIPTPTADDHAANKKYVDDGLATKQDTLTIDATPTDGSDNPVASNGVYDALATKQDTINDLATIRSGAAAGATAVQPATMQTEIGNVAFQTGEKVNATSIINDLTTGGVDDVLSAEQGVVLDGKISQLGQEVWNTLVTNAELTLLGNNTSFVNLINAIELSSDGDSLELKVSNIQDSDTSGFGFSNSGLSANSYYALQLGSNKIGIRATDGTWLQQSKTIPSSTTHIVKIVYSEGKTYLYVDGTLVNTFNYQKTIRINSFGNGGNGTYGYWGGTIDYVIYNGVGLNLFVQDLHNVNTTPTYRFELADSSDYPDGILSYDAQNKVFEFYSRHKQDKYYMFRVRLDQDDSDLVYLKEWRWSYGKYCRYDIVVGTFTDVCDTLIDAENEMAMRLANTIDYTGGIHGDERIDISPDSFVKFFADGKLLSDTDLQADFTIVCKSFMYMQLSSLHETSQEQGEFVSGHPIIAMHYKKNLFQDSSSHLENRIVFSSQQSLTIFHAGMCCPAKGVASFACMPNAIIQEMTGSTTMFYANNKKCALVDFWNPTNGLRCSVEGHTKQGIDDETEINTLEVWDRTTDSKYYRLISRSDANAKVFEQGDVIRNTQDVVFY